MVVTPTSHPLGWKPEIWDKRNYLFGEHFNVPASLPSKVDNSRYRSRIEDQQDIGSCVGHGWSSAIEFINNVKGLPPVNLSRLGMYYLCRLIDGNTDYDVGSYISSGPRALNQYGIMAESLWPYDTRKFKAKPSAKAMRDALLRKGDRVATYYSVVTLEEMKAALAQRHPVVIGFAVYDGYFSRECQRTGVVPMPKKSERLYGGHCVMLDSYDDSTGLMRGQNSYSEEWGDKGIISLPYEYLADKELAMDFKTMKWSE